LRRPCWPALAHALEARAPLDSALLPIGVARHGVFAHASRWSKHLKRAGVEGYLHRSGQSAHSTPTATPRSLLGVPPYSPSAGGHTGQDGRSGSSASRLGGGQHEAHLASAPGSRLASASGVPSYRAPSPSVSAALRTGRGEGEEEELAAGWKCYVSRSSGRPFYKNKVALCFSACWPKHDPASIHVCACVCLCMCVPVHACAYTHVCVCLPASRPCVRLLAWVSKVKGGR